jgi:hypothetical protein
VRFLIDECLSVDLVSVAGQAGHEAQHVAHVGKAGWKDWNVVSYARDGDFILVTNNASDFRRLYTAEPLHAGLERRRRPRQLRTINAARRVSRVNALLRAPVVTAAGAIFASKPPSRITYLILPAPCFNLGAVTTRCRKSVSPRSGGKPVENGCRNRRAAASISLPENRAGV